MTHPLEQKVDQVRSRARRLLVWYALGWTVSIVVATILVIGFADFLIRFQDHGIRLMCSLAILTALGIAVRRFWWGGLRRFGDVQVARRIERRFPQLTDRLASTIEFLKQQESDIQAGSAALRRAVVMQTATDAEGLDFGAALERRPTRRALTVAGLAAALALAIVVAFPEGARTAVLRLARPFGSDSWPKFYHVAFRETPTRLAAGQTFEVELVDDALHRLPDEVRIRYRFETEGGNFEEDVEPMRLLNGARVARRENVVRPFSYRAEGGDDQTEWVPLEVVEPPRIDELQITLHPPAYTGLPSQASDKSIQALRGTRVELAGTATKKLRGVAIHQENGEELPAELSADGYSFKLRTDAAAPFIVDKSGPYWITLEDGEGLIGGAADRWDIRAIADQAPSVTIEQPTGNIFVTPQGEVPIKVAVKDDLRIKNVELRFSRSDSADVPEFTVVLYQGPDHIVEQIAGSPSGGDLGETRAMEHRWSLSQLNLKAGSQLNFWATAEDYLPQIGKSTVRKLTIITPQELEDRLAQRQSLIVAELERVLKLQQDARGQTKALEIQLEQVGQLGKGDIDHAQAAELNQRQVSRTLTSDHEGIPAQIADFMADLANNRVDSPDIERHMAALAAELDRLGNEHLTTIERELTSMIKAAQATLPAAEKHAGDAKADPLVKQSLDSAGENQDEVIASLETMLKDFGQWDSYRRFGRDIAQLQRDQQQVAEATSQLGQKTLGREWKDLEPQQQADLKKAASAQLELSRRLEKIQQQMGQANSSLKQNDPLSAATISDALHQAQQQAISGQMRQSSDRLEKNQLGQAAQQQAKIAKDLDELAGILANRREQELTRLVKQLREAEQEMERLRAKQLGLQKQMRAAAEKSDPAEQKRQLERLAREQKQLEEEAARLARRLERLQAEQAGRSTSSAAGKMSKAGNSGQQGDGESAEQQAAAAEKDLEEAQQQLAKRRREAEEDLAREQVAKMEDSLKSLHERQQKMVVETRRLDEVRTNQGQLTRSQLSTVKDLARQQKSIRGEVSVLSEKLSASEVITLVLEGAAKHMARASDLLDEQHTDSKAQAAEEAARRRLAQLLTAFENKPKKPADGEQGEGEGGGEGNKGPQRDGNQVLMQLKLLKILQEDLNDRYRTLTSLRGDAEATAGDELAEVAADQGKLADLALKLSEPEEVNPEDDPDKLPDVRKDGIDSGLVPPPDEALEPGGKEGR